jgi:general secretion pathway protein G
MSRRKPSRNPVRHAFTLIELLLVLVIITLLAAVVVPKLVGRTEDAKIKTTQASIGSLKSALRIFESDNGRFPTTEEGLQALVRNPGNLPGWKHAYVEDNNVEGDAWGNKWIYRCPGTHDPDGFDLSSAGPDGREGTDDDIFTWKK